MNNLNLQQHNSQITTTNKYEESPLTAAIESNSVDVVRALVSGCRCNPNIQDLIGRTPLIAAARFNNSEIVEILLADKKVDPNLKSNGLDECTALRCAVMYDSFDVIKILLSDPRVDLNIKMGKHGITSLMVAVMENKLEIVKMFLASKRADINARDNYGFTPLMSAVLHKRKDMVQELIVNGADVNMVGNGMYCAGKSALMIAVMTIEDVEITKILLTAKDINPNIQDNFRDTALMSAVSDNNPLIVKELLANPNTDLNVLCSVVQKTALMDAIDHGYIDIAKMLLESPNLDINIKDGFMGNTALMYATKDKLIDLVKIILSSPLVDVNAISGLDGGTALMWTISYCGNNIETVKLLLSDKRVDPNIQGTDGKTALMLAVDKNYFDIAMEFFMHPKIDLKLKDKEGKTAYDFVVSEDMRQLFSKN